MSRPGLRAGRLLGGHRQLEHERRALAGQRLGPHPAAVGLEEAARDRQPEPGAGGRRSPATVERLEDPLQLLARDAGAAVADPQQDLRWRAARARTATGSSAGEAGGVLEHVGERALELRRRRRCSSGSSGSIATSKPPGGARHARRSRRRTTSSTEHQSARGSTAPGLEPREVEQVVHQARQPVRSPARSPRRARARASARQRRPSASPPAAAVIAVSGERRSCETERSTAVLTTFERRSALVSITCASSSSRLRAAATSVSSAGTTRSCSASSTLGSMSRGTSTVPTRRAVDEQRQRAPALVASPPTPARSTTDGRSKRRRDPPARRAQRLLQLGAAQQQPRHLGGQIGLAAPRLRLLGPRAGRAGEPR